MHLMKLDSTPTSEVTPATIRYNHPPHHGHTKVNVMSWIDDSHPLPSMQIDPPIAEIKLFQILNLKLQGQGHECGQSSM